MKNSASSPITHIWLLPFFSDLNDQEKAELMQAASLKRIKRGEKLFYYGDPLTHLYWVCVGAMRLYRQTPDGHELTESLQIVGDLLFDPDARQQKQAHTMNAEALQDSVLFVLPVEWVESHLKTWDNLASKFINHLVRKAQESRIEAEHQATFNATQIVACFLQHICVLHHFNPQKFTLPYTKSIIASRLGMELESFSRVLPKLRDVGINVAGKEVSFTDIEAIQRLSCGSCSVAGECPTHCAMEKQIDTIISKKIRA